MSNALFFEIGAWMLGATLSIARLGPVFFVLPFLNTTVLSGATRTAVMLIVALGFWPVPVGVMATIHGHVYFFAIVQELLIGIVLAGLLAWPFWVFHAVGSVIDNQRGATLSSTIDPANGVDTSELSNFLGIFAAAVYLQGGGMQLLVEIVGASYRLCDPLLGCGFSRAPLMHLINQLMTRAIVLASPIVAALLLADLTLGLLSRFATQLNAFSVSLTVKSVVAFGVLLIYFAPVMSGEIAKLGQFSKTLSAWLDGF